MSEVNSWSATAASNNNASPNGFPEAMAPSGVNDSAREVMAAIARYRADTDGVNASTGSANAYVLAASRAMAAYTQGDRFAFKANFANTGAATLNVDSLGAKDIKRTDGSALVAGDIPSDAIVDVVYDGTNFCLVSDVPLSINGLTTETSFTSSDFVPFYDASAGANRKVAPANLLGASLGGSLVLLDTDTQSGAASIVLELDATNYDSFVIDLVNIKPATDGANIDVTLSSDGSTYFSASYAWTNDRLNSAATAAPEGSASDSSIQLLSSVGNQDGEQMVGAAHLVSIGGVGTRLTWQVSAVTAAGAFVQVNGAGVYAGAAAAYVKILASAGNITGTARVYGRKKA